MDRPEPTPQVCRAAALGCMVGALTAGQLGYSLMETQLLTAAGMLMAYAEMLEHRPRRPGPAVRAILTIGPAVAVNVI